MNITLIPCKVQRKLTKAVAENIVLQNTLEITCVGVRHYLHITYLDSDNRKHD